MLLKSMLLSLVLLPSAALAEWRYDVGGIAVGEGLGGVSFRVECGNGGLPAFFVDDMAPRGPDETLVLQFDGRGGTLLGAACQGNTCMLDFDEMAEASAVLEGLRSAWLLRIGLYRGGYVTEVPLTYAGFTLNELAAQGCDMR